MLPGSVLNLLAVHHRHLILRSTNRQGSNVSNDCRGNCASASPRWVTEKKAVGTSAHILQTKRQVYDRPSRQVRAPLKRHDKVLSQDCVLNPRQANEGGGSGLESQGQAGR